MINWIMDLFPETALELGMFRRSQRLGKMAVALRNWSLQTAGVTVCPTQRMQEYLQQAGLRHPMRVMHHWADGAQIQPVDPVDNDLRARWGLGDKFVVGYSGNFGRAHDFSTIIEAAKRLKHRSDIKFLMIGDGHQLPSVVEAARAFSLDNMIFKPLQPAEHLAESLSVADAHLVSLLPDLEYCIVPSKFYGILAAGRPTIFIGDVDGEVPRVLAETGCGRTIPIGAADALAATIVELQEDREALVTMGRAARQLLVSRYSRENAIDRWAALMTQLDTPITTTPTLAQRSYS
ncbi:glycosyltransferase WbuB [Pseudorhizobium endolithicum]|uniref:Glycosyltransferase WbuB n=2 Tax=Pseudorhizobium endolithicum TaxID=1191678 RepID=A0ABM8PRD4_9HYPH|nr:glycosyltransferase WbuB [Pseudorhizobium endolithicum]